MLHIDIPGRGCLDIAHLALDYNGTIALDGQLLAALRPCLLALARQIELHVLTADTHGTAAAQCAGLPMAVHVFPQAGAAEHKAAIIKGLPGGVACMGNGFNDIPMFRSADLSIAVVGQEGACGALLAAADVVVHDPAHGLELLLKPDRLRATLRT